MGVLNKFQLVAVVAAFVWSSAGFSKKWDIKFTGTVRKINRLNGQILFKYTGGGDGLLSPDVSLKIKSYEGGEELQGKVIQVHEKHPLVIVAVTSGTYKDIESGQQFALQLADPQAAASAGVKKEEKEPDSE